MLRKNIMLVGNFVFLFVLGNIFLPLFSSQIYAMPQKNSAIEVTRERLHDDKRLIKQYVLERVGPDISKAKRWGKTMAKAFGGITSYAFDAIPFEFFAEEGLIEEVLKRLEEGADYIQELKELFKKNIMGVKRKINQSKLAEFLYSNLVDKLSISATQKALLKKSPIHMDEAVRKGTVKKSEYMYFTLLNFVVRYYLEQELKNK